MKRLSLILIVVSGVVYGQSTEVSKFLEMMHYINVAYVDSTEERELVEEAIVGILEHLDPHSTYIPREEIQQMNEPLNGNFEGVGIQFNIFRDTILVVSPMPGGPSEKVGLRAGDKIIEIERETVAGTGIKNSDVMSKLRGKKGSKVEVGVHRRGAEELSYYVITRDKIPIKSVDAAYMANPSVGYIKINRFSKTTMKEFNDAMSELEQDHMKGMILDLRGNGGGYLQTAIDLADEFIDKSKLIVYTEGQKQPKIRYNATKNGSFTNGNLIVLIDEGSASASEIVSGAIQDWDRGLIMGRRSFGKGLVQKPYMLSDGSVIRLTTARYYTPSGRCIQKPYDGDIDEYQKEILKRYESEGMAYYDSIDNVDSLTYKTDKNRVVYGGGGIMPDVFVPLDTSKYTDYYTKIIRKGVLNEFIYDYLDDHRKTLHDQYKQSDEYIADFSVSDELILSLKEHGKKAGIEPEDEEEWTLTQPTMINDIKALIARNLYGNNAYYQIANLKNDTYNKAIEIMQDDNFEWSELSYKSK